MVPGGLPEDGTLVKRLEALFKQLAVSTLSRLGLLLPVVSRYHSWRRRRVPIGRGPDDEVNIPPAHLLMASTGTNDPDWYWASGRAAHRQLADLLSTELESGARVLDFGCGCGRVARHWSDEEASVHGADANREAIVWCRDNLSLRAVAEVTQPPLSWPDHTFAAIYSLSVFTHLGLNAQQLWFAELARLLRPGAPLVVSLHGDASLDDLADSERERYLAGEIVVNWPLAERSNLCGAYHPEGSLASVAPQFETLLHEPAGAVGNPPQDLYLLRVRTPC